MHSTVILSTISLFFLACVNIATADDDVNVASASNGATIQADSEFNNSVYDPGGAAPANRLIDGIVWKPSDSAGMNRWHSQLTVPHPHWIQIRFRQPASISRVTLCRADNVAPAEIVGQCMPLGKRTVQTLFQQKDIVLDAAHPTATIDFPTVVTDNFRLLIVRSADAAFPKYSQLSELQVFGQWSEHECPTLSNESPIRLRGTMADGSLPEGIRMHLADKAVTYESGWMKVSLALDRPAIQFLSVDASGGRRLQNNLLKAPQGMDAVANSWNKCICSSDASFMVSRQGNVVRYSNVRLGSLETHDLCFRIEPKAIQITVDRFVPVEYLATDASPVRMRFDASVTPPSPMGRLKARGELEFPALLHFPDYGTLLLRTTGCDATWDFHANRGAREVQLAVKSGLESRGDSLVVQRAGKSHLELQMKLVEIYPKKPAVDADPRLVGVKRGWLNIFAFRPDIGCLANNTVSDNCLFCMYEYADQAYYTPPLFDNFTALDLVRTSLDSYFDGQTGYGDDRNRFSDVDPSIVISAWDYAVGKKDTAWLARRIQDIEKYADHIIASDVNGDGLPESTRLGISGSGPNGAGGDYPSNWWDAINFGWNDAYGIALDFRALRCAADLEDRLNRREKAKQYRSYADGIKSLYYRTFFNPKTGVLAGWRCKDGKLHDYYFTFITGIAIAYGLVTQEQGNAIMDRMQAKMREVGYNNFRIGLPGNLIPVVRADYSGGGVMGQPSRDDGSDTFQSYENGGTTASFAYFYIQALYALGRKTEADEIFMSLLQGYRDGLFQNGVGSGVDWKRWDGTPCGYEGLLVDTYYPLTALITGHFGRGIPIP